MVDAVASKNTINHATVDRCWNLLFLPFLLPNSRRSLTAIETPGTYEKKGARRTYLGAICAGSFRWCYAERKKKRNGWSLPNPLSRILRNTRENRKLVWNTCGSINVLRSRSRKLLNQAGAVSDGRATRGANPQRASYCLTSVCAPLSSTSARQRWLSFVDRSSWIMATIHVGETSNGWILRYPPKHFTELCTLKVLCISVPTLRRNWRKNFVGCPSSSAA